MRLIPTCIARLAGTETRLNLLFVKSTDSNCCSTSRWTLMHVCNIIYKHNFIWSVHSPRMHIFCECIFSWTVHLLGKWRSRFKHILSSYWKHCFNSPPQTSPLSSLSFSLCMSQQWTLSFSLRWYVNGLSFQNFLMLSVNLYVWDNLLVVFRTFFGFC